MGFTDGTPRARMVFAAGALAASVNIEPGKTFHTCDQGTLAAKCNADYMPFIVELFPMFKCRNMLLPFGFRCCNICGFCGSLKGQFRLDAQLYILLDKTKIRRSNLLLNRSCSHSQICYLNMSVRSGIL